MAKRKRKTADTTQSDKGAAKELPDFKAMMREKDRFMERVAEEMRTREFASPGEANAFLNEHFTGRTMTEILAENPQTETPRQKALALLDGVPPTAPSAKARHEFLRALKTDPDCIEAYLALASLEKKPIHKARFLEEAIAIGRRRFAGLIRLIDTMASRA